MKFYWRSPRMLPPFFAQNLRPGHLTPILPPFKHCGPFSIMMLTSPCPASDPYAVPQLVSIIAELTTQVADWPRNAPAVTLQVEVPTESTLTFTIAVFRHRVGVV